MGMDNYRRPFFFDYVSGLLGVMFRYINSAGFEFELFEWFDWLESEDKDDVNEEFEEKESRLGRSVD